MNKTIFLTGATGFLGTELADQLLKQNDGRIYALGQNLSAAYQKIKTSREAIHNSLLAHQAAYAGRLDEMGVFLMHYIEKELSKTGNI